MKSNLMKFKISLQQKKFLKKFLEKNEKKIFLKMSKMKKKNSENFFIGGKMIILLRSDF